MAALLIAYAVAIAIVFFASRPISTNRPRTPQLARLIPFLLLGYFALTVAGTFAFTFVW
jgi:hypothetical protein